MKAGDLVISMKYSNFATVLKVPGDFGPNSVKIRLDGEGNRVRQVMIDDLITRPAQSKSVSFNEQP